ncbi:MAG: polyprenyl synthetase family protein [Thermoproteales archaeon]|nr:polyprenyl synthetase family protein [Thermoproteales archaeon]
MAKMEDILGELSEVGRLVDPFMEKALANMVSSDFLEIVLHQVKTGGKRVRPALVILSCEACGGSREDALPVAAAIELIHEYSLIFDDIIDRGEIRRGKPTVRKLYGDIMALLAALHYRESISELVNQSKKPLELHALVAETIKRIIEGERLDILFEQAGRREEYIVKHRYREIDFSDYLRMIEYKTAALIEAACLAGAIIADAPPVQRDALAKYGRKIGIAFQLIDDLLDIFGEEKTFGKKVGKDILEHKLGNAIILKALQNLPKEKREDLLEILRSEKISEEGVRKAIKIISMTNAREEVYNMALTLVEDAKKSLLGLPVSQARSKLEKLADFIVKRKF